MLTVQETTLDDVKTVRPRVNEDPRGVFVETYNRQTWAEAGIEDDWVQDNTSVSAERFTLRGLHFQISPRPIAKLVRVVRGSVIDVVVDIRVGSETFGRHVMVELGPDFTMLYVPVGFAHGFCTLEPATEVTYKVTGHWSREVDRGLAWNDPELAILWPTDDPVLSDKDAAQPRLRDLPEHFSVSDTTASGNGP